MSFLRARWPILMLLLVPLLPLWRAVILGEAIGPFDQIRQMQPWNGPQPSQPWDVLQADAVLQFYTWRDLVFEAWGKGQMPFWNHYELAGTPLLANSQSAAFYPPHIFMGVLHVPTPLAITLLAWFHLFWAGLGCYLLARGLGANEGGGLVAGLSFLLSPFMLSWTALSSVITTVSWIPWVLLALVALRTGQWSVRKALVAGSLSTAMMLLSGHLQFAAYGLMAAVIAWLWLTFAPRREEAERSLGTMAATGAAFLVLGGMLAAPQVLPVLEYSQHSHRRQEQATSEGYRAYNASAIEWWKAPLLAQPTAYGLPTRYSPREDVPFSEYWPAIVRPGDNFAESAVGVGPLALLFLIAAPFAGLAWRWAGSLAAIGFVGALMAFGTPLNAALYYLVPRWSATGSPGRAAVILVMAACVLSGLAFTCVQGMEAGKQRLAKWSGTALIALAALAFVFGSKPPAGAPDQPLLSAYVACTFMAHVVPIVATTVLSLAALIVLLKRGYGNVLGAALPIIVASGYIGLVRTGAPLAKVPQELGTQRVAIVNQDDPGNRAWSLLQARPALLPPNTAAQSRIHELGGYDSLLHKDTAALLRSIVGEDPAPPENGNIMLIKNALNLQALADAGVTEIWTRDPAGGVERRPLQGPGRAYTEAGPAEITEETFASLTVRATGPGTLTVKDRNMEGWSAEAGGKLLRVQPGLWMQVQLPEGEQDVRFKYHPPGLRLGLALFALAAVLLALSPASRRTRTGNDQRSNTPTSANTQPQHLTGCPESAATPPDSPPPAP